MERLDLRKYAGRPALSRALLDYIVYVAHDMKRALDLAALATQQVGWLCQNVDETLSVW